jgi:hypothetical protein
MAFEPRLRRLRLRLAGFEPRLRLRLKAQSIEPEEPVHKISLEMPIFAIIC